jgi:hypothetical protein
MEPAMESAGPMDGVTGDAVLTTTAAADDGGVHDGLEQSLAAVGRALDPLTSRPSQRAHVRKRNRMAGGAQTMALVTQGGEAAVAATTASTPATKRRRQTKGRARTGAASQSKRR